MIDIGWSEMAVVALVALLILGPKELPQAMRMVARWVKKLRGMTRDFQSGFDQMVREAELEEARNAVKATTPGSFKQKITDTIDPTGTLSESVEDLQKDARDLDREARDSLKGGAGPVAGDPEKPKVPETPAKIAESHSAGPQQQEADSGPQASKVAESTGAKE